MSKRKERFTPGPWRAEQTRVYGNLKRFADAVPLAKQDWWDSPEEREEAKANAALIAAAPEMYDLLKRIKGMLQFCELEDKIDVGTEHEIGALLAKARGEVLK